jgi:hypothetical protein
MKKRDATLLQKNMARTPAGHNGWTKEGDIVDVGAHSRTARTSLMSTLALSIPAAGHRSISITPTHRGVYNSIFLGTKTASSSLSWPLYDQTAPVDLVAAGNETIKTGSQLSAPHDHVEPREYEPLCPDDIISASCEVPAVAYENYPQGASLIDRTSDEKSFALRHKVYAWSVIVGVKRTFMPRHFATRPPPSTPRAIQRKISSDEQRAFQPKDSLRIQMARK